jgi:hypothetical protein
MLEFKHWLKVSDLKLNHSLKERPDQITTKKMERQVEAWFINH